MASRDAQVHGLKQTIRQLTEQNDLFRAAAKKVASLNPDAGEIGAGMLRNIVTEARAALSAGGAA